MVLNRLNIANKSALAIEDSPNGLRAAQHAGIDCLIAKGPFSKHAELEGA